MVFILLVLIPVGVSVGAYLILRTTITLKEFLLQLGLGLLVVTLSWFGARYGSIMDTEYLNGRIVSKEAGTQHCCHCQTVCDSRDKDGSCRSSHEDCPHFHDYFWKLHTSVGSMTIESCSGWDNAPTIWRQARVGDPASVSHTYLNYLRADPESLFSHTPQKSWGHIPAYPALYAHYKRDPVIGWGVAVPAGWQEAIRNINADLGASRQVDVAVVLTGSTDPTIAQVIETSWLYGPKNSITLVLGLDGSIIRWVRVVTFSRVPELKMRLRDRLQTLSVQDPQVLELVRQEIALGFHRTSMAEFEYLLAAAQPKGWVLALLVLLQVAVSVGLTVWMHKQDLFRSNTLGTTSFGRRYRHR